MRLTKATYYADFVIYAVLVVTVCLLAVWRNSPLGISIWFFAALIGAVSWTLIEYLLHRFALHRIALIAVMHDAHHRVPLAFIGTPTWLSLGVIGAMVFMPAWALEFLEHSEWPHPWG